MSRHRRLLALAPALLLLLAGCSAPLEDITPPQLDVWVVSISPTVEAEELAGCDEDPVVDRLEEIDGYTVLALIDGAEQSDADAVLACVGDAIGYDEHMIGNNGPAR
jgi:hypothetical protein